MAKKKAAPAATGEGPRVGRRAFSTHKRRSSWFQARATWPFREAPVRDLVRERKRMPRTVPAAAAPQAQWQCVGPTNIGGRLTSIVAHPADPNRIWVGAAGGGVWKSEDAGKTWTCLWHSQDVLNVGSLAMDPADPNILYCCTGEANLSADSYPGVGIYRSADGGKTWKLHAAVSKTGIPSRIGVIAIDPFDRNHILIGGVTHGETDPGGMYTSRDGGVTWKRETFAGTQSFQWCHDIKFHPGIRGTIYATFGRCGTSSGIWRSIDGGLTWSQLRSGLPSAELFHRTTLALAPSNPSVVYALAADTRADDGDALLGIFRSANGGNTWRNIAGAHFKDEGQMSYGNTIVVHPANPNHVLCGGVDLHLTTDAKTWRRVSKWDARRGAANYAHADHHALLMPAGAAGRVYDANDGGLDVSEDGGLRWTNRSNGLAVTMFYDVDVAASDGRNYGGGAQDNGTLITTTAAAGGFFEKYGGDGGWIVYHPSRPDWMFVSAQFMWVIRFKGNVGKRIPFPQSDSQSVWMVYIMMDPNNPDIVFTASTRVWRTKDFGDSWTAVTPPLDGSPITAIEIAPADSRCVYVGTEKGGLFYSKDGGDTWSGNLAGGVLPGRLITRIETHPQDARSLLITVSGRTNSHLFHSADAGATWSDLDGGKLPKAPHHAVVIPPDEPQTIYVAGDTGVSYSTDFGKTWFSLNRNLPNTMVVDLVYQQKDGTLTAATYGRSLWRLNVRTP